MTHIHFLFAFKHSFLHEGREIFFAGGETPDNSDDKPKSAPEPKKPEAEKKDVDPEQEAKQAMEDAKLIADTQAKALNMVNAELKKWNDAQRAQKSDHADKAFQELPEDARDDIRDTVMQNTGAKVSEAGVVTVTKSDIGMNKMVGSVGKFGRQIGKMLESLRPILEKLGMKFDDKNKIKEEKEEKKAKEEAKDKVKERLDKGEQASAVQQDIDDRIAGATAQENFCKNKMKQVVDPKLANEKNKKKAFENELNTSPLPRDKGAIEADIATSTTTIQTLEEEKALLQRQLEESTKKRMDAEKERDALNEMQGEKEKAKTDSIPADGAWHMLPLGEKGYMYKKSRVGTPIARDASGLNVMLFKGSKWVDAAQSANINDPVIRAKYNYTLANDGDAKWVTHLEDATDYRIDAGTAKLLSKFMGRYREYNSATGQWDVVGQNEPPAPTPPPATK